ncbi:hypothetical protein [Paenibacillus sp. NPDC058177]|uniref:hypothetical protein n=1 Tax=Paenibacillus sp. NPDC058177 TaxID=3346369 RepID=UPI0036DAAAA9
MNKKILETIISSLLLGAGSLIINLFFSYLFVDKGVVRIGEPIEVGQNQFQISISILNSSDKNINNIEVNLPLNIEKKDIISSQPIVINRVNANYGINKGSIFNIPDILGNQKLTMVVTSSKIIYSDQVKINKNGNNIEVEYFDKVTSPFKKNITSLVINSLMFVVLLIVANYLIDRRSQKRIEEYREMANKRENDLQEYIKIINDGHEKLNKDREEISKEVDKLHEKIKEITYNNTKWRILYSSRLNDFRKELTFWKDTVRRVLYKTGENNIDSQELFNIVTTTLQTYQTKVNAEDDYETLKVMSKMFEEKV